MCLHDCLGALSTVERIIRGSSTAQPKQRRRWEKEREGGERGEKKRERLKEENTKIYIEAPNTTRGSLSIGGGHKEKDMGRYMNREKKK